MKATVKIELTATSGEMAQEALLGLLEKMRQQGLISIYSFEVEAPEGLITERCVISEGKVVA